VTSVKERARRWLPDAWPCLPFLACGVVGTQAAAAFQPGAARAPDALAYLLVVAAALSLAARRRPGLSLALNGAAVTAYLAAGFPYGPVLLTVPAAVYGVASRRPLRQASLVVAADFGVLMVAAFAKRTREAASGGVVQMLWQTLVWGAIVAAVLAVGTAVRVRRESVAGVRAEQARRVASEERLRMAQDLHDSVGHGLAVIAMQAGVALHVLDRNPEGAREAMEAVRATSRESLENLRAELEALRSPGAAQRRPAPGLEDLSRLTDRVRAGGVAVRVDIDPDLPALPPAVDAVAYRILQESLTNVLRHAGAAAARIRVVRQDATLLVDITDTGATDTGVRPCAPGGGSGIRGMRAQAEALGGTLHAGPRPVGGFVVAARLPLYGGEGR
jgi:signal transduction histidine kinase